MKGLGRKVSFLAVAAVIATALLGAAYTLWSENLTVNATVTTGNLDVEWTLMNCWDDEDLAKAGRNFNEGYVYVAKEVGSFTDTYPLQDELTLTISNAYPGYAVDCKLDFQSIGTVPVHIEREMIDIDLNNDGDFTDPGDVHIECTAGGSQPACRNLDPAADPWWTTTNSAPVYARWINSLGCQLHQGDPASGDLFIGVRQPAAENTTYRVKFTVQFNQWNESGWNGCANPKTNPVQPVNPPPGSGREN